MLSSILVMVLRGCRITVGGGLALLFLPILFLLRPFVKIKIGHLESGRIGHLIANTEVFLRERSVTGGPRAWVVLISGIPANRTLLELYRRQLTIVESLMCSRLYMYALPILRRTPFHLPLAFNDYDHVMLFNTTAPSISLNSSERTDGDSFLLDMGLRPDDWFVCIHARDDAYLHATRPDMNWSRHAVRNCSILNFEKAARLVTETGGYVFRMGAETDQDMRTLDDPRIIDYVRHHRTDFLDVYLAANCRFFLGCTSGVYLSAWAFGRPVAHTNLIPIGAGPYSTQDLYTPKLFRRVEDGSLIHFRDLAQMGLIGPDPGNHHLATYHALGIEPVENSEDDVAGLCAEMLWQTEGRDRSREDREIQAEFCRRYLSWIATPEYLSKPAINFLREYHRLIF